MQTTKAATAMPTLDDVGSLKACQIFCRDDCGLARTSDATAQQDKRKNDSKSDGDCMACDDGWV
jgi:hypothetical protein